MSLPPLDLAATARTGRRILLTELGPTWAQSAVFDELHDLGDCRRDWVADLPGTVGRAEANGLPTSTIAAALGLTQRALRRDLPATSRRGT